MNLRTVSNMLIFSMKIVFVVFISKIMYLFSIFSQLGETKLIFWCTGKTAKKIGSLGRQNKNNII